MLISVYKSQHLGCGPQEGQRRYILLCLWMAMTGSGLVPARNIILSMRRLRVTWALPTSFPPSPPFAPLVNPSNTYLYHLSSPDPTRPLNQYSLFRILNGRHCSTSCAEQEAPFKWAIIYRLHHFADVLQCLE